MEEHKKHSPLSSEKNRYTFSKKEKLKSKKVIQELFVKGSSTFLYPFKLYYQPFKQDEYQDATPYPQMLVSVSKRNFKKAVDRNRIKRQVREAYRLNKHILQNSETPLAALGFVYVSKKQEPYSMIEKRMKALLKKLKSN
ncbi:ribonuclease P protein component [Limibacter armeniacum]|uniref:ribonuclease P protein component n=1 Tax=Limibacter armeniacum TaxID=466084 RepID=UPI002FE5F5DE